MGTCSLLALKLIPKATVDPSEPFSLSVDGFGLIWEYGTQEHTEYAKQGPLDAYERPSASLSGVRKGDVCCRSPDEVCSQA